MWTFEALLQGYPGRSPEHGALGWTSVGLFRSGDQVVLTDPGSYHCRGLLVRELVNRGLAPGDVTAVLLTHLHWDHSCNFPLFRNAQVVLSAAELAWASAGPADIHTLPELHVQRLAEADNVTLLDLREQAVLPGISLLPTPGHTPGHCSYLVETADRAVLVTGDAAKNRWELSTGQSELHLDAGQSARSIARLARLAADRPGSLVLCGHDRLLTYVDGEPTPCEPLRASVTARVGEPTDPPRVFDLS
jgi:N-acyl homoserine lactone hydrolase